MYTSAYRWRYLISPNLPFTRQCSPSQTAPTRPRPTYYKAGGDGAHRYEDVRLTQTKDANVRDAPPAQKPAYYNSAGSRATSSVQKVANAAAAMKIKFTEANEAKKKCL